MPSQVEWFRSVRRWGQVTIRENEVARIKPQEWGEYWSRCALDGVTINAGGYIAFYPTRLPLHHRAPSLGSHDPFGDLAKAAKASEIRVVARVEPSRCTPETYFGRPEWFFLGADGSPRRADDRYGAYYTCINTSYYWEQVPNIYNEIMDRYDVDGFWADHWQGYGLLSGEPCHCAACTEKYRLQRSAELPKAADWSDPNYRTWIEWWRSCLGEVWAHWDDTLKLYKKGITFIGHPVLDSLVEHADLPTAPTPEPDAPLWQAGEYGRLLRSLTGGGKRHLQVFDTTTYGRVHARPAAEQTLLMASAVATGAIPCFHIPSAAPEDKRAMEPVEAFYRWHAEHEASLIGEELESAASVAVIVSERTGRYYEHDADGTGLNAYTRGVMAALAEAGIPYDIVHDTQIARKNLIRYRTLVLPNIACLDAEQCDVLWDFGSDGGGLVVTFETSVYDENGAHRGDYGMTDRLGVKLMRPAPTEDLGPESYFRIRESHEALEGAFSDTALLAGGGRLLSIELQMDHKTPLTLVPPAPMEPLEAAWTPAAGMIAPAMTLGPSGKGRLVYFPTEPDRLYWEHGQADHADLLATAVRWANRDPLPVELTGSGRVAVSAYRKGEDLIVHLVNLSGDGIREGRCSRVARLAPQDLKVRLGGSYAWAELLVSGQSAEVETADGVATVHLPELGAYEVVALRAKRE